MKPIKLTDAQMDAALGLETHEMDHEKTGNRKCWHVIDLRDKVITHEGLTVRQARQQGHYPFGYCRDGFKLIQCDGDAHSNPYIDNCMVCAPRWGWVMVPESHPGDCPDCGAPPRQEGETWRYWHGDECPHRELTHAEKVLLAALK